MNNALKFFATLILALSSAALPAAAQLKIGTVDVNRVFNSMPKTESAKVQLRLAEEAAEKEFKERMDAYKTAVEQARKLEQEANSPALSENARAERRRNLAAKAGDVRKLELEINEFRQTRMKELQEQLLKNRKEILDQITAVAVEISKAEGFDLVIDKSGPSAAGIPVVLFGKDAIDFTDKVIAQIEKSGMQTLEKDESAGKKK